MIETDFGISSNLHIGEDRNFYFNNKESDGTTPKDVSSWALVHFEIMLTPDQAIPVIDKTIGDGITVASGVGTNDQHQCVLSDVDTEKLTPGRMYWRLRRADAGSELITGKGEMHWQKTGL